MSDSSTFPLESLSVAVVGVSQLPVPSGLGADLVLVEQVGVLASAVARLQQQLAVRMAALEREGPPVTDVRGEAVRAGLSGAQAGGLRLLGRFAHQQSELAAAWAAGSVAGEQVDIVRRAAARLDTPALRGDLVAGVLPHLPGLDARATRRVVGFAADQLQPGDPDQEELADHAARYLSWSQTPRGGIVLQGYLPAPESAAFTAMILALRESLRVAGDGLDVGQRNADALAALVARATAQDGPPSGGGLPAVLSLLVDVEQASRVALRDPAEFGTGFQARPRSGATLGGDRPAGDAAVRFGVCCASVSPVLLEPPDPDSLLGRVARAGLVPLAAGRSVRLATPTQRRALQLRDGGCVIPACEIPAAYTQPHHVTGWAIEGATDLDNLVSLCWVHHRLTELGKYVFQRREPDQPAPPGAMQHQEWWIVPPRPGRADAA